jgi:hypothetical protein
MSLRSPEVSDSPAGIPARAVGYSGLIGVIEACCGVDPLTTNKFHVINNGGRVIGEFDAEPLLREASYDISGRYQLILSGERLFRRLSGGGMTPLGTGFSTAAW